MIGWNRITSRGADKVAKVPQSAIPVDDVDTELGVGNVQLEIKSFDSFHQINRYTRYLSTIENLRIISESWSEDEGLKIIVSVRVPLALARLLEDMPEVARVHFSGGKSGNGGPKKGSQKIVVEMKTTEADPEPVLV